MSSAPRPAGRRRPKRTSDAGRRQPAGESECGVYAIVRNGRSQTKVSVGDVIEIDGPAEPGATVELPAVLLVDGETVTSDADALAAASVTAEVLGSVKGPKIRIQHYKNKSGYKRRLGHRQRYAQVKVTDIKA